MYRATPSRYGGVRVCVCVYVCMYAYACVCTCNAVSKSLLLTGTAGFESEQGGNDSFDVHCPTKTTPLECELRR